MNALGGQAYQTQAQIIKDYYLDPSNNNLIDDFGNKVEPKGNVSNFKVNDTADGYEIVASSYTSMGVTIMLSTLNQK